MQQVFNLFSKRGLVSFFLAVCALLSAGYGWNLSRPVALADALTDRLSCVSYAPFHGPGQSPDKTPHISVEQIEADLAALAQRFACVRTYSIGQGIQEVPRLAQKLGIKVLLGVWIGPVQAENEKELGLAIEMARKYPDAIRALVVGNEVLLHKLQSPQALRAAIERVKLALPGVPVTYADTWEYWLLYQKDLLDSVPFATVHIIPYWENDPMDVERAVGHVSQIYRQVKDQLKGKEVMIGETGWPSYGRQRQDAEPSQINQARFIREFALRAEQEKIPYSVIEAFDQPWKRDLEGAVGGTWGLFTADGKAKFPFRGPVAEAPAWSHAAYASMLTFFGILLWARSRRARLDGGTALALLAVSIAGGGAWAAYCRDMLMANRGPLEWAYTGLYAILLLAAIFCLGGPLAAWCAAGDPPPRPAPASQLLVWGRRDGPASDARLLGLLRFAFLFGAALVCLMLVFDPGSRDFPLALFAVPAVGFSLLAWVNGGEADVEERVMAVLIACAGLWTAVTEHITMPQQGPWQIADGINQHALAWALLCLLLAGSVLGPVWTGSRRSSPSL